MQPPLYSTITLFAEIIVSAFIFYAFYQGYKYNKFPKRIVFVALAYEILFNISYMTLRSTTHNEVTNTPGPVIALAAFHGISSLVMFISLIVFMVVAWKKYSKGINYFKEHQALTIIFLIFWTMAVVSGISFYIMKYFLKFG